MNIYIPIEIKARELEGRTLLAIVAAEKGHSVVLGEKNDTIVLAKKGFLPPGIVHDKSLTPGEYKLDYFEKLRENGHLITSQDEESGLLDESYDKFANIRFSDETISMTDKVFAWGDHDANCLKKVFSKYQDRIVSTGSPRVDFWRTDFDNYFDGKTTIEKPYILVASNFGSPIDENTFWDRIARLRKAGYFERDPDLEKHLYENTAYQFRLLHRFVEMIRNLSESFPDVKILVRPHPVESTDAWMKLIGEYPNVFVKREGTISDWIRNSLVLIHNGCTSALEAAVSGIPRIAYRPIPHEIEREIPNDSSLNAFSLKDLNKKISDLMEKGTTSHFDEVEKRADKIVKSRLSSLKDQWASEKIVEEWSALGSLINMESSTVDQLMRSKPTHKVSFKRKFKRKAVILRDLIVKPSNLAKKGTHNLKTSHKFPSLSDEDIYNILHGLQQTHQRFLDVKAVRFGEKSFIFYRN